MLGVEQWNRAYHFALINAAVFVVLSVLIWFAAPESPFVILSAPVLFSIGAGLSFFFMLQSGGAIAPIAWFVLGSGVFFGLGSIAGGLQFHPWTAELYGDDYTYLIHASLLNACSTLIVLAVAYPLSNPGKLKGLPGDIANVDAMQTIRRYFPFIVSVAAVGVGLKYLMFPWAEDLLIRSLAAKLYLFIPCSLLLLGLLWRSTGWKLRMLGSLVLLLEMSNGLLALTKYQVLAAMLALIVGLLLALRMTKLTISALLAVVVVFFLINPVVSISRAHVDYDAATNSIGTRIHILGDAATYFRGVAGGVEDAKFPFAPSPELKAYAPEVVAAATAVAAKTRVQKYGSAIGRLMGLMIRFDLAPIQGYLVNEYNSGRPGKSLEGFWAVFIPRAIWPEKPIISSAGPELHKQYFDDPNQVSSALAPSYSAEAYWNYGPLGVVIVSVLLGLGMGWLTRCSQYAAMGLDPAYFLIAFPVLLWASFVESWIVASYLGEFIIFAVLLLAVRVAILLWNLLCDRFSMRDGIQQSFSDSDGK